MSADGGQVVEADHGDVVGDAQPVLAQRLAGACRDEVVAGEDGREVAWPGEFAVAEVSRFLKGAQLLGRVEPEQLPYIA